MYIDIKHSLVCRTLVHAPTTNGRLPFEKQRTITGKLCPLRILLQYLVLLLPTCGYYDQGSLQTPFGRGVLSNGVVRKCYIESAPIRKIQKNIHDRSVCGRWSIIRYAFEIWNREFFQIGFVENLGLCSQLTEVEMDSTDFSFFVCLSFFQLLLGQVIFENLLPNYLYNYLCSM